MLSERHSDGDEVMEGALECTDCGVEWPVRGGVPRMVPESTDDDAALTAVKDATAASFGYEWKQFARHGWDGKIAGELPERRRAIERASFFQKALVEPHEFAGRVVLDAGCGNGRYVYQAAELGAEVVGVDLSEAVDVAFSNIGRHERVHIVQGDLFRLPFKPGTFDRVFSIGVLMHTGDAQGAFERVAALLKPDGLISIHVYSRGNAVYEWVDQALRRRTLGLDHESLLRLSRRVVLVPKAVYASRKLTFGRPILSELLNCFIRLEPQCHNIFDWYSAPAASHHTYGEVYEWFRNVGLDIVADRNRPKDPIRRLLKSPAGGVTVKGRSRAVTSAA